MWAVVLKLLSFLVPPDPGPWDLVPGVQVTKEYEEAKRAMRRWQQGISLAAALALTCILVSAFTPYGFALAGEAKEQAETEVKPLAESVQKLTQQSKANETANVQMLAALNELRAVAVANNIDRLVRRKCVETDIDELQQLRRDIDQQRSTYRNLAKSEYAEPTCAEVRRN